MARTRFIQRLEGLFANADGSVPNWSADELVGRIEHMVRFYEHSMAQAKELETT